MEITSKIYWPQHKVYLFGMLAFFPGHIEGKEMRASKLRHYFDEDRLTAELQEYEQAGYFTVHENEGVFVFRAIDSQRFLKELSEYVDKVRHELPSEEREQLWDAAARQYRLYGYSPTINWQHIYGDTTRYKYSPQFWELIFAPALAGQIKLIGLGYTKTIPMPKELLPFYERPFAKFDITDKALQKRVAKLNGALKHKATLVLTGRNLWLKLDGKPMPIKSYRSTKGNAYRTASALYEAKRPLAKDELNLKTDTKSELKDLLSNAGIKSIVRNLFVEAHYDTKRHVPTLTLKRSIEVGEEQYEQLLEYVNSLYRKAE